MTAKSVRFIFSDKDCVDHNVTACDRCPAFTRQNRWQPVMLLDDLGPFASRGHLRQWEEDNGGVAKGKNCFYAHVAHRV